MDEPLPLAALFSDGLAIGGPVGLPPSPFFILAGNSKLEQRKEKRKEK
jgi:hypothetical protein